MATGTLKWFSFDKGYGLIEPDAGGGDIFLHISAVERAGIQSLKDGQKLAFEIETGRNGKSNAADLKLL